MFWRTLSVAVVVLGVAFPAASQTIIEVPTEVPTLSQALTQVPHGGVIELSAGSYQAPSGGFIISNPNRSFTIRAASGATVTLTGMGTSPVLRFINSVPNPQATVIFENLVIADGRSALNGAAGGITLEAASATFRNCLFRDNTSVASITGGGGTAVFIDSVAHFTDCEWRDNTATNEGAGLRVGEGSAAYVHRGLFTNNRTNLAGHRPSAAGGGIHITNSEVWVTNSRFDGNQTGYAGGAIYVLGTWQSPFTTPRAELVVTNCTFVDNEATPHFAVTPPAPTEGGAIHSEDQARAEIINSRFVANQADLGGGVSSYRSDVGVSSSVFLGNRAVGVGASTGFGGAFKITSDDSHLDGPNYPNGSLVLEDSFVQCRYGSTTTAAQVAAGLFAKGDVCRNYGNGGCDELGTDAANRSVVRVDNVVFADCDVDQGGVANQGLGGAMSVALTDLGVTDSLVVASNATGSGASGGGLRVVIESNAVVDRTTFASNSAVQFGAGVFAQGTAIDFSDCQFFDNEISPGVNEGEVESFGAAMFVAPLENWGVDQLDFPITGTVADSVLSRNVGMPIFDDDRNPQPINAVRYNNNDFNNATFGSKVYRHNTAQSKTPSELNTLVIPHSGVDKGFGNGWLSTAPELGALLAVPPRILNLTAVGDPESVTRSYLGYAWDGGNATLDGTALSGGYGWGPTSVGTHNLWVQSNQFQAIVGVGPTPAVSFTATPAVSTPGQPVTLAWSLVSGTFVDVEIDHGLSPNPTPSGQLVVTPSVTTTYSLHMATEEGGATATVTVCINCESPLFSDGFESGDISVWSTAVVD